MPRRRALLTTRAIPEQPKRVASRYRSFSVVNPCSLRDPDEAPFTPVSRAPRGPGVAFMTYVPELQQVYYAEKGSNVLKVNTPVDATGITAGRAGEQGRGWSRGLSVASGDSNAWRSRVTRPPRPMRGDAARSMAKVSPGSKDATSFAGTLSSASAALLDRFPDSLASFPPAEIRARCTG